MFITVPRGAQARANRLPQSCRSRAHVAGGRIPRHRANLAAPLRAASARTRRLIGALSALSAGFVLRRPAPS